MGLDPEKTRGMHDETMPKDVHKVAHFCSMRITQDVRDYAAKQGITEEDALQKGMQEKAGVCEAGGGDL